MKRINVTIVFILLLFNTISCTQSGYKTFVQTKGYDHYSFEYPASYQITMNSAYSEQNAVNGVRLVGKLANGSEITMAANIDSGLGSVQERIDKTLSVSGRELVERYADTVSGVSCEVIILNTAPFNDLPAHYEKMAFFDYNGRNWDFFIYSDMDNTAEVDLVFDHLFNTFELLA